MSHVAASASGAKRKKNAVSFKNVRNSVTEISHDISAGRTVIPARRTAARLSDIHQSYGAEVETVHGIFGKSTARMVEGIGEVDEAAGKRLEWVIENPAFHFIIGACIAASTIQMGLEADFPEQSSVWTACEYTFTMVFILEAVAKVYVLRMEYVRDPWNRFDGFLVFIAVLNLWVLDLIGGAVVPTWVWRLLRLSKLTRTLRLVRTFKRLFLVTVGVWEAMKATFWVAMLLALAIYAGAILCVGLLGPGSEGVQNYPGYSEDDEDINGLEIMLEFNPYLSFGNVPRAMLTLFNLAILAEWREVTGPVARFHPYLIVFFFAFMAFVTFGLMNVLIGLIVNEVIENSQNLRAEEQLLERRQKLDTIKTIQQLVADIDSDNDGKVSIDDFERSLADHDSPMSVQLAQVDLPLGFSPLELLSMLDSNGDGTLNHDEFVMSFYRLLDGGPFQHSCLVQQGINSLKFGQRVNETRLERIESQILLLAEGLRSSGTLNKDGGPIETRRLGRDSLTDLGLGKVLDRMRDDKRGSINGSMRSSNGTGLGSSELSARFRGSSSDCPTTQASLESLDVASFQASLESLDVALPLKGAAEVDRSGCRRITEEAPSNPAGWATQLDGQEACRQGPECTAPPVTTLAGHKAAIARTSRPPAVAISPPHDEAEEAECKAGLPANSPCLPGPSGSREFASQVCLPGPSGLRGDDSELHTASRTWQR